MLGHHLGPEIVKEVYNHNNRIYWPAFIEEKNDNSLFVQLKQNIALDVMHIEQTGLPCLIILLYLVLG